MQHISFDIFCQVIDNYGDIGVSWRLAKNLAKNHKVRLWVDKPNVLSKIEPNYTVSLSQKLAGVNVVHWQNNVKEYTPYSVVIETFGCELQPEIKQAIKAHKRVWINLEYLSAEKWVENFHLQPSPQPQGISKTFFMPGFSPKTGGLIKEPDTIKNRIQWQAKPANKIRLLKELGISSKAISAVNNGALVVFLFCYPEAPVQSLVNALVATNNKALIIAPEGVFNAHKKALKTIYTNNSHVFIHKAKYVSQDDFDKVLWSADINLVRGEDSFIRAIWAARPMIWQPYIQAENANLIKLQAFLNTTNYSKHIKQLIMQWNTASKTEFEANLKCLLSNDNFQLWKEESVRYSNCLAQQTDLASNLVSYCSQELNKRLK